MNLAEAWGIDWLDYQAEVFEAERNVTSTPKVCLFFRTGAGKTFTALALMHQWGVRDNLLVVSPPATHDQWTKIAERAGMTITTMSHAKYRMKSTKLDRKQAVIVDEFHMLGGHKGQGWIKMDRHAAGIQAPLVILSATPNYNDAERVYCVQHVLDPHSCRGGFLAWLYANCQTKQSPFSIMPEVIGFLDQRSAHEHLAELPHVYHVEDPHKEFPIVEKTISTSHHIPENFRKYGLIEHKGRISASMMEDAHVTRQYMIMGDGVVRKELREQLYQDLDPIAKNSRKAVMIFCTSLKVLGAVVRCLYERGFSINQVHGDMPAGRKAANINKFRDNAMRTSQEEPLRVLIGTAALATGVDGLDQVCDTLILLDDTNDESLRRQIIGRILPRGLDTNASGKQVIRYNFC